ncbi:MAG: hypothetical protein CMF63_03570 [Magnetovibrio sp.]|nr:hypothetical protein [Magnetovibrio sp.]|tara:strand:- start:291 stop:758 length:468 start_codon:yes stop_codon:yes gene_type:complete
MKFLIFNIAIFGALYYLFTTDVSGARDMMTNSAHQAVNRVETLASSVLAEARNFASKRTSAKEIPPPTLAPKPESKRIVPSPVKTEETAPPVMSPVTVEPPSPPSPPEPVEMAVEMAGSDETTEAISPKNLGERRKELLDMARNMELFYLRKAGE